MYNWNTDTTQLEKNPEKYVIWKLEQLIKLKEAQRLEKDILK